LATANRARRRSEAPREAPINGCENREARRRSGAPRCLRCATVNRQHDPFAETLVLPRDELAVRREQKRARRLTPAQVQRLLVAAELRKKATQGENDE
jgi:hypothetical protein